MANMYKSYDLIRRPVVTEKSTLLGDVGKYVFEVSARADKSSIKVAVEAIFDVKVKKVNIVNLLGKRKVFKGVRGCRSDLKKAIVTVESGSVIDFGIGV